MTDAPERYGRRNVAKMIRQVDAHRHAVRAEGSLAIQETWDRIEEHIDYAYRADVSALQARIDALVEALEFYADESAYETQYETLPCDCCTDIYETINRDKGAVSRAAIKAARGE